MLVIHVFVSQLYLQAQVCSIELRPIQCITLESNIQFHCPSLTPNVRTSFPICIRNLTQITEDLQVIAFENALTETKARICTFLKFNFYFQFH